MSNIGLMEGAFFVGRKEIVDWINATLELNISKVEDTSSGAVACQLFDIMHPGVVPMHKVNWNAKQNFEIVANYKILQTAFTKLHVDKFIDVDRLISGKYMDNLEFMQWFKRFYELSVEDKGDYNCQAQRMKGKGWEAMPVSARPKSGTTSTTKPSASSATAAASTKPAASKVSTTKVTASPVGKSSSTSAIHTNKTTTTKTSARISTGNENIAPKTSTSSINESNSKKESSNGIHKNTSGGANNVSSVDVSKYETEITTLRKNNEETSRLYSELKVELEGIQKERDFYFDKLRDIEVLLQEIQDAGNGNTLTESIFKILYATAEGFETTPIEDSHISTGSSSNNGDHGHSHFSGHHTEQQDDDIAADEAQDEETY